MAPWLDVVVVILVLVYCVTIYSMIALPRLLLKELILILKMALGAKTTESIEAIVDRKLDHHLFLRWSVNRIASQKVLQKKR